MGIYRGKGNCTNISLYSNQLKELLNWRWDEGPKDKQNIHIPNWIKAEPILVRNLLRGLFQTDGSIYKDRGYLMVNFVNTSSSLANDVQKSITELGYSPNLQKLKQANGKVKYTIRITKDVSKFIKDIKLWKE